MNGEPRSERAWVVLGASSSVARAFARQAAAEGSDIVLAGRDRADLERTAADIRVRSGRRVEVRGYVLEAGGPLIELSHPEQLRILP